MFIVTEIDAQIISEWQGFFGMAAGTAAGLAGLVFVALSMHQKEIRAYPPYRYRASSSLASMMMIFVLAALVLIPRQTNEWLGLEEMLVIGADSVFLTWTFLRTREAVAKRPHGLTYLRPYRIRTTLAVGLSLIGVTGGSMVWAGLEVGFYVLAVVSIVTMLWVVLNSWALVVGISGGDEGSGSAEAK
jgi:hypothetical protein